MAKTRLDWFKLDCQCDDKIELIEAEFGLKGFAVIIKLYQRIYGGEGYYCEWNDDVALLFSRKIGLGCSVVSEIIQKSVQRGIFDRSMLENYGILTSHGIQKRYYECAGRRQFSKIRPEYALVQCTQNSENADNSGENVYISHENADISSAEKKREDKSRLDKSREDKTVASAPVFCPVMSQEDYDNLCKEYGKETIDKYIRKIGKWQKNRGKKVSEPAAVIRKWLEQDGVKKDTFDEDKYAFVINNF